MIKKRKIKTEEEERWKIKPAEWEINLSETKKIPSSTFNFFMEDLTLFLLRGAVSSPDVKT